MVVIKIMIRGIPETDFKRISEINEAILRNHPSIPFEVSGSSPSESSSNLFGIQQIDYYQIYTGDPSMLIRYDYHLFYQHIHHLFSTQQFAKILHIIHQYDRHASIWEYSRMPLPREETHALSLTFHLYAKALENLGFDDHDVIEAYWRAYEISSNNYLSVYEILSKRRNLDAALKIYHQTYGKKDRFPVRSLTCDVEAAKYIDFLTADIKESRYFGVRSGNYAVYLATFEMEIIDLMIRAKEFRTAYQIANRIMLRAEMIPEHVIREVQLYKAQCIDYVKNDPEYIGYPTEKIARLREKRRAIDARDMSTEPIHLSGNGDRDRDQSPVIGQVIFTVTTCKRFDLFEKTMNSFINCSPDADLDQIAEWLCVDDNSSEEDRQKMMTRYPFFRYIFKGEDAKGHIPSMNIIRNYVLAKGYKYTLHFEDDWQSVCAIPTIQRSIDIMEANSAIKQVVHNRNYVQLIRECDIDMPGGYLRQVPKTGDRYILHQFYMQGSPEFIAFQQSVGATIANWPYYSLNPSLLDIIVYRALGPFEKRTWHFEFDYAVAFLCAGFKTAFLDGIYRIHIGKLLGDDSVKNAYELNDEVKL